MGSSMEDEISRLTGEADDEESDAPKPKRRIVRGKAKPAAADDGDGSSDDSDGDDEAVEVKPSPKAKPKVADRSRTLEDLDTSELLPADHLEPAENVKTLGDLYAKYSIGQNPGFQVAVHRTWPKMAPGGKKIDGFYDSWDTPLTVEQIQSEYGGGTYRLVIMGPHPKQPNVPKHYESLSIQLAGDPNFERKPRAQQTGGSGGKSDDNGSSMVLPPMPQENPKLAEKAMELAFSTADREREERKRLEDRSREDRQASERASLPVVESERRRADDLIRVERERSEDIRKNAERQLAEARERFEAEREAIRAEMDRVQQQVNSRPSMAAELRELKEAGIIKDDNSAAAKEMLAQVFERHRADISAMQASHSQFIESLRSAHERELVSLRETHQRELANERGASGMREQRIEERLAAEREERRRDQERHQQALVERDNQWRDRMENNATMIQSSWESRHQSQLATYESRIQWLQQEIDRTKSELLEVKSKQAESQDLGAQLSRLSELKQLTKDTLGLVDSVPASTTGSGGGGIGLGGADDWRNTLAEGFTERLPDLVGRVAQMMGGGGMPGGMPGSSPGSQAAPQEGSVIQVADPRTGQPIEAVVVRDPVTGQLGWTPKDQYDQAQGRNRRGLLGGDSSRGSRRARTKTVAKREPSISVTPNLADGLPRRRPPWEGGGDHPSQEASQTQAPPPMPPSMMAKPAPVQEQAPVKLSPQERQGVSVLARLVHESVMSADEPNEFVAKLVANYPAPMLKQIIGQYDAQTIARAIAQQEPASAGATPGGQAFTVAAFDQLKETLDGM